MEQGATKATHFPELRQRFKEVTSVDIERKELQILAEEAQAARLEAENVRLRNVPVPTYF